MNNYVENLYNKWKSQPWSKKFQKSGIYCIKDKKNHILYVGKSQDMLMRAAQHRRCINFPDGEERKYRVLHDIEHLTGNIVHFDVLEYCEGEEKLGYAEGWWIRKLCPPLNSEIPKENWREWEVNERAMEITAQEVIDYFECMDDILKIVSAKPRKYMAI